MMDVPEIIEAIRHATGRFALEAVQAAIDRREEVTPALLAILEDVAERGAAVDETGDYIAPLYAMFLLAQFRETRAYPIIVRIALLPCHDLDLLFGEFVTERLNGVLASVCGGDLAGIKSIVECKTAYVWARCAALGSMVTLVACGLLRRDAAIEYLRTLFTGALSRTDDSLVWAEAVSSACDLHPRELMAHIEQAYRDRLVDTGVVRLEDVRHDFTKSEEWVLSRLARDPHKRLVNDTVKEFGSWSCFHRDEESDPRDFNSDLDGPSPFDEDTNVPEWYSTPGEYAVDSLGTVRRADPKVGRNDPCPCGSGKKFKKCCGA